MQDVFSSFNCLEAVVDIWAACRNNERALQCPERPQSICGSNPEAGSAVIPGKDFHPPDCIWSLCRHILAATRLAADGGVHSTCHLMEQKTWQLVALASASF